MIALRRIAALVVALALTAGVNVGLMGGSANAAPPAESGASADILVIGHRGASGYRPEHTLASYDLAIRLGADFIEPDLVSTKDGVLVARHENEISGTTNVADHPEFADRKTTKVIDGVPLTGWFTEDFTFAEIKTLRAIERIPDIRQRNTIYNGRFQIPTFQEVIDLAVSRGVGIYPETKHPTYFDSIGLSLEEPLVAALRANDLDDADDAVFVQSFETTNLRELNRMIDVPLVQLIAGTGAPFDLAVRGSRVTYDSMSTRVGVAAISTYADGIGPDKNRVIPRDAAGFLLEPTALVDNAHRVGLVVHPYTFRAENTFLPADFRSSDNPAEYGDLIAELHLFFSVGVDGVFTDNPDIAVYARAIYQPAAA